MTEMFVLKFDVLYSYMYMYICKFVEFQYFFCVITIGMFKLRMIEHTCTQIIKREYFVKNVFKVMIESASELKSDTFC